MATAQRDYYEVLGVPRDADQDAIRRAYRRLARRHHPDVSSEPGAEERFKEIGEANDVLSDPERRRLYDRFGHGWRQAQATGAGSDDAAAGRSGGRPGPEAGWVEMDEEDLGDILSSLFGGQAGRGGGRTVSMRGSDLEAELGVTLEEAARGGPRTITVPGGATLQVQIPRGVTDGRRIRLAGQGAPGAGGGPPGDLYVRLHLLPHPRFRAEGRDLHADLPVAPWEAALGASVEVPTLTGSARVKVPAGSSSGRRLRLRGQGLPGPAGEDGDLYLTVAVRLPATLTDRERDLFTRLAEVSAFDPRRDAA